MVSITGQKIDLTQIRLVTELYSGYLITLQNGSVYYVTKDDVAEEQQRKAA